MRKMNVIIRGGSVNLPRDNGVDILQFSKLVPWLASEAPSSRLLMLKIYIGAMIPP